MKRGLLLLNLGTPDEPTPEAVGRYLREFLMDGRVVDVPWPVRWFFVNVLIVPKRKVASAHAYKLIWSPERGSPLSYHLEDLKEAVTPKLKDEFQVEAAMRYGNPSVRVALEKMASANVDEVLVFPLYPQYAESSTLSSQEFVTKIAKKIGLKAKLRFVPAFYDHPAFIQSAAAIAEKSMETHKPEHVLMSFHGLPEKHVERTDRSGGNHCLKSAHCCHVISEVNRDCYRAQCFATARALATKMGLSREQYSVSFQSRLGRRQWIRPYTDEVVKEIAARGVKRLAIICPAFVADCLETIEEIGMRASDDFKSAGGESLVQIPCVNSSPMWVDAVARMARENRGN